MDIANTYIEVLVSRTRSFNVEDSKTTREFLEQQQTQIDEAAQRRRGVDAAVHQRPRRRPRPRPSRGGGRPADPDREHATPRSWRTRTWPRTGSHALKSKVESMPPSVGGHGPARDARARARRRAADPAAPRQARRRLETQLLEYQTQYTDEHPRVMTVKRQIADVQKELGDAVKETHAGAHRRAAPYPRPTGRPSPRPWPRWKPPACPSAPRRKPSASRSTASRRTSPGCRATSSSTRASPPRWSRTAASTACCPRSSPRRASASRAR